MCSTSSNSPVLCPPDLCCNGCVPVHLPPLCFHIILVALVILVILVLFNLHRGGCAPAHPPQFYLLPGHWFRGSPTCDSCATLDLHCGCHVSVHLPPLIITSSPNVGFVVVLVAIGVVLPISIVVIVLMFVFPLTLTFVFILIVVLELLIVVINVIPLSLFTVLHI